MPTYRMTYRGEVRHTFPAERPADVLFLAWKAVKDYREVHDLDVRFVGREGCVLGTVRANVTIAEERGAATAREAVADMMSGSGRIPTHAALGELTLERLPDPAAPAAADPGEAGRAMLANARAAAAERVADILSARGGAHPLSDVPARAVPRFAGGEPLVRIVPVDPLGWKEG